MSCFLYTFKVVTAYNIGTVYIIHYCIHYFSKLAYFFSQTPEELKLYGILETVLQISNITIEKVNEVVIKK